LPIVHDELFQAFPPGLVQGSPPSVLSPLRINSLEVRGSSTGMAASNEIVLPCFLNIYASPGTCW